MNSSVDLDWNQAIASASPQGCTPVLATDPLYILYTSGTTGDPKVRRTYLYVLIKQRGFTDIRD